MTVNVRMVVAEGISLCDNGLQVPLMIEWEWAADRAANFAMNEAAASDRFAALSVRNGLSLGILYSSRVADFNLMLAAAAVAFAAGRSYAEREVNDVLRDWLAHEGSMLAVDHVELRRWMVDCRVLDRDDYGRAYTLGEPSPEIAAAGRCTVRHRPPRARRDRAGAGRAGARGAQAQMGRRRARRRFRSARWMTKSSCRSSSPGA